MSHEYAAEEQNGDTGRQVKWQKVPDCRCCKLKRTPTYTSSNIMNVKKHRVGRAKSLCSTQMYAVHKFIPSMSMQTASFYQGVAGSQGAPKKKYVQLKERACKKST